MRLVPLLPAAFLAGLGAAAPDVAWADSPVVIEGLDEDNRRAVLDLLPDRDAPASLFDAERIAEEAAERAMAWLRSEGYYSATVTPEANDEPPSARLIIAPGPRFRFAPPKITLLDAAPTSAAMEAANGAAALFVHAQAPARAEAVLGAEGAALLALQQAGFADAAAAERRVVVDHATRTVSPEFRFTSGSHTRLGQLRVDPDTMFRANFVEDLRNWRLGESYSPERMARLRRDITSTGAVSLASTRLEPPNADGVRDVVLEVEPARRNAYEVGLGYSTNEGFGIDLQWTRRNFTGRADSLIVATTLGEQVQELSARLARPHDVALNTTTNYGVTLIAENTEAYQREGVSVFASVDAGTRLSFAQSYGLKLSADTYDDVGAGVSTAYAISGFWDVRRDTTGFSLDPREGSIIDFRLEPTYATGDADVIFLRSIGETRLYESFGADDRITLAGRLRAGWLEAVSGDVNDVPADRRFFAGGGGSVRGYDYNSIHPPEREILSLTPGGQGLVETSVEARWRVTDTWGAAVFIDGGNAFDDWGEAADLRWGVGFGVRYDLGFAPLRLDIAFPLDDDVTTADYALYISLGQAF
ncbi:MAG: BamA/TamA family outer membrane protein [Terricaulis sp.]|nr:BamA/TamA family outer membrane protein [Terricaulis sp.]